MVMVLTLLITAGGLAAIVWHARGSWLTTQVSAVFHLKLDYSHFVDQKLTHGHSFLFSH